MQASALRKERSGIIGMIVPMYDNRYFGSIAQTFEDMARSRGFFPIVTCTRRDPELEAEAARSLLAYRVEHLICTGATDPDRITEICEAAGVPVINLDLPGTKAPSVISDNYRGALELTRTVLSKCDLGLHDKRPLIFVGGRPSDHNTRERIRGFKDAHMERGISVDETSIFACGYAAEKAEQCLAEHEDGQGMSASGIFVNSTISLEGVVRWLNRGKQDTTYKIKLGCFDWDPFAALLREDITMVRQDIPAMVSSVFRIMGQEIENSNELIEIPPIIVQG